jgi:hypothetical protein
MKVRQLATSAGRLDDCVSQVPNIGLSEHESSIVFMLL